MKTKEELNALKEEVEALNKKLLELNEEELAEVAGGTENNGSKTAGRGKNGQPTLVLWDEASTGLITDTK